MKDIENKGMEGTEHRMLRRVMAFVYLLQKLRFMLLYGEIIGDKTDTIEEVI